MFRLSEKEKLDDTEPDRDIVSHRLKKDLVSRQRHSVTQTEERPGKLDDTEPDRNIVSHRLKKDLVSRQRHSVTQTEERPGKLDDGRKTW